MNKIIITCLLLNISTSYAAQQAPKFKQDSSPLHADALHKIWPEAAAKAISSNVRHISALKAKNELLIQEKNALRTKLAASVELQERHKKSFIIGIAAISWLYLTWYCIDKKVSGCW